MKFSVNSKILQGKLNAAIKAVPNKSPLQILNNFLLRVADGKLTITSSDTECTISVSMPVDTLAEGSVCVDAKFLSTLIKNTASVPVTFELKGTSVIISTPSGTYRTAGIENEQYPNPDIIEDAISINTNADFIKAIQNVSFACSDDNFHQIFMGVCVDCSVNGIRVYATDTRRLAKDTLGGTYPNARFVIPAKTVSMLSAMAEGDITIRVGASAAEFSGEGFVLRTQLLNGNFPDCERIIPHNNDKKVFIDRATFIGAVRRALVCSDNNSPAIRLDFSGASVNVSTRDIMMDREANEMVPISGRDGDDITIGFMADYLLSMLENIGGEDVAIRMSDPGRPALFSDASGTESLMLLCMPITLVD